MSQVARPRLVLTGLRGGSGKTVVTLGLIGGLRRRGFRVAPFKKGPDYIDPAWLALAASRPCHNLDAFLMSPDTILASLAENARRADVSVVEGNRGLFDGMDASGTYSSAELAKLLEAPVVLVADCTKSTRTVAAMALGCRMLDAEVRIAGVVLNHVANGRQESVVTRAMERDAGLPVLGAVRRMSNLVLTERHLGLLPPAEHPDGKGLLEAITDQVCRTIDLDRLMALAQSAPPLAEPAHPLLGERSRPEVPVRIGVVRDSAFHFYYPENLTALERRGAELVDVSPIHEQTLPEVDALYIGGGFPETHASLLARNETFRASLREHIEHGLPVYGECGGLIYLSRSVRVGGVDWPMVGVFDPRFSVERKPQGHGYEVGRVDEANPWFEVGTELRGHEFRYCRVLDDCGQDPGPARTSALQVERGCGFDGRRDGLLYKNVWASFCHVHALTSPQWASSMLRQAEAYRRRSLSASDAEQAWISGR